MSYSCGLQSFRWCHTLRPNHSWINHVVVSPSALAATMNKWELLKTFHWKHGELFFSRETRQKKCVRKCLHLSAFLWECGRKISVSAIAKKRPGLLRRAPQYLHSAPLSAKLNFWKSSGGQAGNRRRSRLQVLDIRSLFPPYGILKKKHKIQKSWYLYTCYEVAESGIFWHLLNPPVCSLPVKGKTKISIKSIDHDPGDHILLLFPVYFTASSDCRIPYMLYKLIYRPSRVFREIKDFSNSPWKCNLTLLW